jgi:hypothetical protein
MVVNERIYDSLYDLRPHLTTAERVNVHDANQEGGISAWPRRPKRVNVTMM